MVTLEHIVGVLVRYSGRFRHLDVFADDVAEFRSRDFAKYATYVPGAQPIALLTVRGRLLRVEVHQAHGVLRCSLDDREPASHAGLVGGAAFGAALGIALGAASESKDGVLGGLVLGMLAGAMVGAAADGQARNKILTLRYDERGDQWRVYSGTLLPWAKGALDPGAS